MQANGGGVEVDVGVDGDGVAVVVGHSEGARQVHEGARDGVVDLAVPFPVFAVFVVFGVVAWLGSVDVFQDLVEAWEP